MVTGETYGSQDDYLMPMEDRPPYGLEKAHKHESEDPAVGIGSTYAHRVQGRGDYIPRTPLESWHGKQQCANYIGWITAKNLKTGGTYAMPAGCGQWHCPVCGQKKLSSLQTKLRETWDRLYGEERSALLTLTVPWKKRWLRPDQMLKGEPTWEFDEDETTGAQLRKIGWELVHAGHSAAAFYWQLTPPLRQKLLTACWSNVRAKYWKHYHKRLEYVGAPELTKQGAPHLHMVVPQSVTNQGEYRMILQWWTEALAGTELPAQNYRPPRKDLSPMAGIRYIMKYITKNSKMDYRRAGYKRIRRYRKSAGFALPIIAWTDSFATTTGLTINRHEERRVMGRLYYWLNRSGLNASGYGDTLEKRMKSLRYKLGRRRWMLNSKVFNETVKAIRTAGLYRATFSNARLTRGYFHGLRQGEQPTNRADSGFGVALQWQDGSIKVLKEGYVWGRNQHVRSADKNSATEEITTVIDGWVTDR